MTSQTLSATVKLVLSGDTIVLRGKPRGNQPPAERQLSLLGVSAPRMGNPKKDTGDELGAFESREHLRTLVVGKQVQFTVSHTAGSREYGQVFINGQDVVHIAVSEGWVKVRTENNEEPGAQALLDLEQEAQKEKKGLWSDNLVPIIVHNQLEAPQTFINANKGKQLNAIVEQVRDGSTIRIRLILDSVTHQFVNIMLAGIKCPTVRKGFEGQEDVVEEFGEEAKFFTESRLLQRSVKVTLLTVSQSGNLLIGTVQHPAGNISEALVVAGLAKCVDWMSATLGAQMQPLRAAEKSAKENKLKLWHAHVSKSKNIGDMSVFEGQVIRIWSADTISVRHPRSHQEKKLQLSSIRQPKPTDPKTAGYQFEAREFLRKKLIGKTVHVSIDYHKPAQDGFEERDCASIMYRDKNIALDLIDRGYASVIRHRRDDEDRSPMYDQLLAAEQTAISEGKGIHNTTKEPPIYKFSDASENAAKARQFLPFLQRQGRVPAIVEYVSSGSRFKLYIPKENVKATFVLCGIIAPRTARQGANDKSDPFGQEAYDYAVRKVLQRDVEIEVENVDKTGGFIGTLWINQSDNFALQLLEEGFAKVHSYSADQSPYTNQLYAAERGAKIAKKNIWSTYDEEAEANANGTDRHDNQSAASNGKAPEQRKEYIDVMVTEIASDGSSFQIQTLGAGTSALEKMMAEFSLHHKHVPGSAAAAYMPKVGDLCSAKFTQDNAWYRAKVRKIDHANKMADVLYIDYGNWETVPYNRLRALPGQFSSLPAQAQQAVLSFIKLPNKDYVEEATEVFRSLTNGKQLVANVNFKEGSILHLTLFDPKESKDELSTLNGDLVREGFASVDRKSKRYQQQYPRLVERLIDLESAARSDRVGMWEYGDVVEE